MQKKLLILCYTINVLGMNHEPNKNQGVITQHHYRISLPPKMRYKLINKQTLKQSPKPYEPSIESQRENALKKHIEKHIEDFIEEHNGSPRNGNPAYFSWLDDQTNMKFTFKCGVCNRIFKCEKSISTFYSFRNHVMNKKHLKCAICEESLLPENLI